MKDTKFGVKVLATKEDKVLIKILLREKDYEAKEFVKVFQSRNWSLLLSLSKLETD